MEYNNLTNDWIDWDIAYNKTELADVTVAKFGVWKVLYSVLEALIIFSNVSLLVVIIVTKELRLKYFYGKVFMCVLGDLLLGLCIPFVSIADDQDFWKSDFTCQLFVYYMHNHGIFLMLTLSSLLIHPILIHLTKKLSKTISRFIHILVLIFPAIVSFGIFLPVSKEALGVKLLLRYSQSFCLASGGGTIKSGDFLLALNILTMAIAIPSFISLLLFICIQRSNTSSRSEGMVLKLRSEEFETKPILERIDETVVEAEDECDKSHMIASMVITAFTWICVTPYSILSIYLTRSPIYSGWLILVTRIFILVHYIPVATRPLFWLITSDMRGTLLHFFQTCKNRNQRRDVL